MPPTDKKLAKYLISSSRAPALHGEGDTRVGEQARRMSTDTHERQDRESGERDNDNAEIDGWYVKRVDQTHA